MSSLDLRRRRPADRRRGAQSQRGATLVVALVMLTLLSLLGATVARIALYDTLGTRGARDHEIAFEAADATLRDAEVDLRTGTRSAMLANAPLGFVNGCGTGAVSATSNLGLCLPVDPTTNTQPAWETAFSAANANVAYVTYGAFTGRTWVAAGANAAPAPHYVIEALPFPMPGTDASAPRMMFRITAEALGPAQNQRSAVQSIVLQ